MKGFISSSCGELINSVGLPDQRLIRSVLPDKKFWDFISRSSSSGDDIMLVDVDVNTWLLLLNQVAALKLTGSKMVVYAVAYDAKICENLIAAGVPCYFEDRWVKSLFSAYKKWTGATIPPQEKLIIVQLGRMVATMIAVCENRNVFLSDGDVVFYRNPLDYVFDNVNIMITSTSIGPAPEWGAPYFADQPKQYYTLNNGVVYYKSNAVTKAFLLTLTVKCIAILQKGPDLLAAFLQTTFHAFMLEHHLLVQPSRYVYLLTFFFLFYYIV